MPSNGRAHSGSRAPWAKRMTALEDMESRAYRPAVPRSKRLPAPDPRQQLRKLCAVNQPDVPLERERARSVGHFARGDVEALACLAHALGGIQGPQRIDARARRR